MISQFASVVTSTSTSTSSGSGTGGYPPSATTFAAGLGLSNFDIAAFVPVGCIFPAASFYDKLVFKTVSPVVVISLLWTPTLVKYITRKESANSARTAARWSLFLLELIVSSVSTSVVQTFACTEFKDDGGYLTAELTLACDASPERKFYQAFSGFMIIVYPIGELFACSDRITTHSEGHIY